MGGAYYSLFVWGVIPPQTGWWQYMAQRLSEGELLYQDIFMYVPPYFAWLTTFLYQVFGNHFMLYSMFGLIFFRISAWGILYLLSIRFTKPWTAAVGVLFGVCLTSSYLMDQTYDYNPLLLELAIIQAYLVVRIAEGFHRELSAYLSIILEGIICGLELMLKQNIGLVMPIAVILTIIFLMLSQSSEKKLKVYIPIFIIGIIIAVLPGALYLLFTNTIRDFWICLIDATKAKTGSGNILLIAIRNFIRPLDLLISVFLTVSYQSISKPESELHQYKIEITVITTCAIIMAFYKYIVAICDFIGALPIRILLFAMVPLIILCSVGAWLYHRYEKNREALFYQLFFPVFVLALFSCLFLSNDEGEYLYYVLDWPSLKTHILYVLLYLNIIIWFAAVYHTVKKKDEVAFRFAMAYIVLLGFLAVSFASASLEELYALLMTPAIFMAIECYGQRARTAEMEAEAGEDIRHGRTLLRGAAITICCVLCILCCTQKRYMPYEWHSWRTGSLLGDAQNVRAISIEGLEGFKLPSKDADTYEQIIQLIKANSKEGDTLYQFPNIPLFNVLTNRKSVYAAIPYFDVCPDSVAEESAQQLYENPPEMILWSELSEGRWSIHEEIFRDGNPSGQRALQRYYEDFVKNEYALLGAFDNNEGELITLWKRV